MGSDLAQLKSLSMDDRLRRLVTTLVVEDDCVKLDPWTTGVPPDLDSPHHLWPRTSTGIVNTSDLGAGVSELVNILCEKLLRPNTIRIRDYRISDCNLRLCPEMARVRELIYSTSPVSSTALLVSGLAKEVVDRSRLGVTSLTFRPVESEDPYFPLVKVDPSLFGEFSVWSAPKIQEATIEVSRDHEGQDTTFSMLCSADMSIEHDTAQYWLE